MRFAVVDFMWCSIPEPFEVVIWYVFGASPRLWQAKERQPKQWRGTTEFPLQHVATPSKFRTDAALQRHALPNAAETHPGKKHWDIPGLHEDITETPPRHEFTSDAPPIHHQDDIPQLTRHRDTDTILRRARHLTRSCAEVLYTGLAPPCCKERPRGPWTKKPTEAHRRRSLQKSCGATL